MSRPLLICDCDEVLLHMVRHFGTWLREHHDIDFSAAGGNFAMSYLAGGTVAPADMWSYLDRFFPAEMSRQTLVPHAAEALTSIAETADIVILTNLLDHCREARMEQLSSHGISHRVVCNQGGKGSPVARLVAEYAPTVTVFVDDLPTHHESVAKHQPQVHRLHMVSEPDVARTLARAPHAHARIDDWREALAWISDRFDAGLPADPITEGAAS